MFCWLIAPCFLRHFGFNRGRKAILGPLVFLARKDFQVLKACLDHRDLRYVTPWAWWTLCPPNPSSCPPHRPLRPWRQFPILVTWWVKNRFFISCLSWASRTAFLPIQTPCGSYPWIWPSLSYMGGWVFSSFTEDLSLHLCPDTGIPIATLVQEHVLYKDLWTFDAEPSLLVPKHANTFLQWHITSSRFCSYPNRGIVILSLSFL